MVFLEQSLLGPTSCLEPKRRDYENFGSKSWTSLETCACVRNRNESFIKDMLLRLEGFTHLLEAFTHILEGVTHN